MSNEKGNVNLSVGAEYKKLLDQIAKIEQRSQTSTMRMMIDARARALGLTPVFDVKALAQPE